MKYYNDELYHSRTKGSKNGVRLYQYKDGTLTPAGKRRYLKGNTKGSVSKEFEEEYEYNSRENEYFGKPSSKSKSKRVRPQSKADQVSKKIVSSPTIDRSYEPKEPFDPSYRRVDGERPFRIRNPKQRQYSKFDRFKIKAEYKWRKAKKKIRKSINDKIHKYFENSYNKYIQDQIILPKGSDGINHLTKYTLPEADDALNSYIHMNVHKTLGSYVSAIIQISQMNIANACTRFLDSIGLDDEVDGFLNKLNIKPRY